MNKELAMRTLAYLIAHYKEHEETIINSEEIEAIESMLKINEDLEQQCKKQKEVIDKVVEYIENEMPYLQETDKEYEDINGNTYFTYKEYDGKELLDILKEVSE